MEIKQNLPKLAHILLYTVVSVILVDSVLAGGGSRDLKDMCKMCKSMATAFTEKVKATAKSNFGGGNTRWEEKSLGSYAFSETRLLEITEALCSKTDDEKKRAEEKPDGQSMKHGQREEEGSIEKGIGRKQSIREEYESMWYSLQCHGLLESNEELLEYYWFNVFKKKPETADLYQWLCLEQKKVDNLSEGSFYSPVCCGAGLFGPECSPCSGGKDSPCSAHGKCDGEATRGGTGKCLCDTGYHGDVCDECGEGYYGHQDKEKDQTGLECKACHISCKSCTGGEPADCGECRTGYIKSTTNQTNVCEDVDECENKKICSSGKYCSNTVGSYVCMTCDPACNQCLGGGNDRCVSCKKGYQMEGNKCVDIDECAPGTLCTAEHMYCQNTRGGYKCLCRGQYEPVGDKCMRKPPDPNAPKEESDTEDDDTEPINETETETPENETETPENESAEEKVEALEADSHFESKDEL